MTGPLTLSQEETLFRDEVARFSQKIIAPHVQSMDENQRIEPGILKAMSEMGLLGIEIEEKYGGAAGSFFMSCLAVEEISKVDPAVGVLCDVQNTLINTIIRKYANPDQKQKLLPRLASGEISAYCLTESHSGSDAFALKTKATDSGDHWLLEGEKIFITNAMEANIFVVFANINPKLGYKGITAFIVERGMDGFKVGKKEDKMGIRASSTCELIFNKVKLPKENVIGEIGKGYKISIDTLNEGRIGIGAQLIGLAHGALAAAIKYSNERDQFGSKIKEFQGMQFQIADMATQLETARLLVYQSARLKDANLPFIKEAAMAKYYSSQVAENIASLSLEIFGGYGFVKEYPAEKFYRDAKIGKLYEGTSNMQLQTIFKIIDSDGLG